MAGADFTDDSAGITECNYFLIDGLYVPVAPKERRASTVAWVFASCSIASVVGVPIGTTISIQYSWRALSCWFH